jgi:isopentenyldiphosphate isomerase
MERRDLYNADRMKTGEIITRGQPIAPGAYHLVIHVCIFRPDGAMLTQQRQPFKEGWPRKWDITVGGSAVAGESSRRAAECELFEMRRCCGAHTV